jgi:hypothetical protein
MGKVRESQRRAADAWDAKNMLTIGCKMRREIAEDFKQYATDRRTTPPFRSMNTKTAPSVPFHKTTPLI